MSFSKNYSIFEWRSIANASLAEVIAVTFFEFLLSIFAVWTVLTHFGRILNISLSNLSLCFSLLLLPLVFILIKRSYKEFKEITILADRNENYATMLLVVLMLVGAIMSLGAIRPDTDDVDYTSQIIYFFNHPDKPIDLLRHDHGALEIPFHWPIYIFYSLELLCAYIAGIFHVPFLHVYYYFLPVLGGLSIPLAWYLAFSKFTQRTMIAVLAAVAVCVFFSLNGSPHRSFGNFAFVRIWQGKTMLMAILTPLFIAFSIDFFRTSTVVNWLRLFIIAVAASGLTAMSAFYLPLLGIVGISYWLTLEKRSLKNLIWFFSSYAYLIIIALYFKSVVNKAALAYHGEAGWPTTFTGQFKMVFINYLSFPSLIFIFFTALSLILAKKPERYFLGFWLLGALALLNPLVFPFLGNHVTSLNNYWRLFYLLPIPFVIGFPVIGLEHKIPEKPVWGASLFMIVMLIGVLGNTYPNRYLYNYGTFAKINYDIGKYKISPELNDDVQQIIAASTPGVMLSPYVYSSLIPVYSSELPQVSVRDYMLMSLEAGYRENVQAKQKIMAVEYISGNSPSGLTETLSLLDKGLTNLVIDPKAINNVDWDVLEDELFKNNFKLAAQNKRFLLYAREEFSTEINN